MRLLDLFCGAGGAATGYCRAGFEVVGVDIKPQKHYPFEFHQADAFDYLRDHGQEFDVIHASPPCQAYSKTHAMHKNRIDHPDYVGPIRDLLAKISLPWVIENVNGAPLWYPAMLCGHQFGLKTFRHRYFESPWIPMWIEHKPHPALNWINRWYTDSGYLVISGNIKRAGDLPLWKEAMGIDWMNAKELSQAIPPAYTEWIGKQLMKALK